MTRFVQTNLDLIEKTISDKFAYSLSKNFLLIIVAISFLLRFFWMINNDLLVEEAYYWNYAQHLDFSFLDHPPMVALLINVFTSLLGNSEFPVRFAALGCWFLTVVFSVKLTRLFSIGAEKFTVMLLSVLPFFFLQSVVITPDQPLIVCWSASLYYLYRSLVLEEPTAWYKSGLCLGLGMLSKYSIVLLAPSILLYMVVVPRARQWFIRKEPYYCLLITFLLFSPVIYWNAKHDWISFVFQSTRRFDEAYVFSLPFFLGFLFLFLLPSGMWSLFTLIRTSKISSTLWPKTCFFQLFTLTPLLGFGTFSIIHQVKFNWIGPGLLAILPWVAADIQKGSKKYIQAWLVTVVLVLFGYASLFFSIFTGVPQVIQKNILSKFIAWNEVTKQINQLAQSIEVATGAEPIIVPLDTYNIQSELVFYQSKLWQQGNIVKKYPTLGRHIFGPTSLMFQYWVPNPNLHGKTLLLISRELFEFNLPKMRDMATINAPIRDFWAVNQAETIQTARFYYQIVQVK